MEKKEFISKSPSDTLDIGESIGKSAKAGEIYALYGELGAGKTQLVKGMARGIGVRDWQYVVSPSFTILNVYEGFKCNLCHVDLYRIENAEFDALQVEDFLENSLVAVEWAERAVWWNGVIKIKIEVVDEDTRKIVIGG